MLKLCFSSRKPHELVESFFYFRDSNLVRHAVRGKTSGVYSHNNTFQWTNAVIALCYLFIKSKIYKNLGRENFILQGESGSLASSLDYAIAKSPQWIIDMFGIEQNGSPIIRKLINRTNPERRHPGPVLLSLNTQRFLESHIQIHIGNELIEDSKDLLELIITWVDEKENSELLFLRDTTLSCSKISCVAKQKSEGTIIKNVLSSNVVHMDFRSEWLSIINGIIKETQSCLRGMVYDSEVPKWWDTLAGRIYLTTNLSLVKRGIRIKRIFILNSLGNNSTLLDALVHENLGIDVKISIREVLESQSNLKGNMFSVHDNSFAAIHHLSEIEPKTTLIVNEVDIKEQTDYYEHIWNDDRVSLSVKDFLKLFKQDSTFFEIAKNKTKQLEILENIGLIERLKNPEFMS